MTEGNNSDPPFSFDGAPPDRNDIRADLIHVGKRIKISLTVRDKLIRRGDELGIGKTELAELAGISRQTVYDILARAESDSGGS